MIDMHSHILPGLDDGASTLEEAIEMARQATADGITAMAATPHGPGANLQTTLQRRDDALDGLRLALHDAGIPLRLFPGMEFMAVDNIIENAVAFPQVFYGAAEQPTRLLLLELFPGYDLQFCSDLLFQAQLKNIRLILAHPERYQGFLQNPGLLQDLLDKGLILQFNAASLAPSWLNLRRKSAILKLIRHNPEQVVLGSDAHDTLKRPAVLSIARHAVCRKLGENIWKQITLLNPARLIPER